MTENSQSSGPGMGLIIGGVVVLAAAAGAAWYFLAGPGAASGAGAGGSTAGVQVDEAFATTDTLGSTGGLSTVFYEYDQVLGDIDAPVVIFEYASWTCPHCRTFHASTFEQVIRPRVEDGTVKFVQREILRNLSDIRVSLAARCEGIDLYQAADSLFPNQQRYSVSQSEAIDAAIVTLLSDQGMTAEKYAQCATDSDMTQWLSARSSEAGELGATGTPSVFMNGRKIELNQMDRLDDLINQAAERALN